jgi:hypothetical protein
VALPFLYLFDMLASVNLNLSSVNVTCSGSQAPIELLINCFILGLLVIIIRSDYQLLFNILLNNLNQRFILNNVEQRLDSGNFRFSRYFFICLVVSAINAINPFQVGLRYCMGFVRIDTFGKNRGIAHEVSESCNKVNGAPHFDSFLGYTSTIFAWWLILPAVYCLAEVVVTKCKKIDPLKKRMIQEKRSKNQVAKIFPADLFVDESVKKQSEEGNSIRNEESDDSEENESDNDISLKDAAETDLRFPELPSNLRFRFPGLDETVLAQVFREAYDEAYKDRLKVEKEFKKSRNNNMNGTSFKEGAETLQPNAFRKAIHKVTKKMPFILAFYYYCKQKYLLMISVDLWVSNLFSSWITVLKKNTMKLDGKVELMTLSQRANQSKRVSAKKSSVKTPGVKQLFSLNSGEFIQEMRLYDLEQLKKQEKMDSLWEKERLRNDHSLPSYYELCLIVRDELHESILEPFNSIFALIGIGHFFTPTGRYYWKVVLNNYKIFLCVCLGIWTDEAVEAYGLEETSANLSVDGRAFLYKREETTLAEKYEDQTINNSSQNKGDSNKIPVENHKLSSLSRASPSRRKFSAQVFGVTISQRNLTDNVRRHSRSESEKQSMREVLPAVISVLICSRVILFQIVPALVLFSTVSMTLASFPLFIFNDFLVETLPALVIYGTLNREMAIERELQSFVALHPETKEVLSEEETTRVLSEEYSWRLSVRGIVLFWNESRLLQFIQSSLTLFFSFLLLIYTRELLVYLIVILGILLLFILSKSLVFLLYLGSSLDLKDSDFPIWFRLHQKRSSRVVVPEGVEVVHETSVAEAVVVAEQKLPEENEMTPSSSGSNALNQSVVLVRSNSEEKRNELSSGLDDFELSELTPSIKDEKQRSDSDSFPYSFKYSGRQSSSKKRFSDAETLWSENHSHTGPKNEIHRKNDSPETTLTIVSNFFAKALIPAIAVASSSDSDYDTGSEDSVLENVVLLEDDDMDIYLLSAASDDLEAGFPIAL